MANRVKVLSDDQLEDFREALRRNHSVDADFELAVEEDLPASQEIFAITGRVTVRRKSTGMERTYPCGHGTPWPADFEIDLNRGYFEAHRT